jgi:DNA polymerase III subunit chi
MTAVQFHFNVPERMDYVCRLLRKAVKSQACVRVCGPEATLQQLDRQLWTFEPLDFVPHIYLKPGQVLPAALQITPILLQESLSDADAQSLPQHVLLNLGATVITGFEAFNRLIEVVSLDQFDRDAARVRWKYYADSGLEISRHDVQLNDHK